MKYYKGIAGDSIERGGSFNDDNTGHEVCNFNKIRGKVFGYVQQPGQIKIEKLGAEKGADYVSGVTVVWTASPESGGTAVVGWYRNATVYRNYQEYPKRTKILKENNLFKYRIQAKAEDATLLPPEDRNLLIPRAVKGGFGESNIWYADSPEGERHIRRTLKLINKGKTEKIPDVDRFMSRKEGNPRLIAHLHRERNQTIVKKKKNSVIKSTDKLCCEVCGFDFKIFYGELGTDFCEVHHLQPLSKMDGEVHTSLDDLAIVCSNCHRMLHRQSPMPTLQQLKKVIKKSTTEG